LKYALPNKYHVQPIIININFLRLQQTIKSTVRPVCAEYAPNPSKLANFSLFFFQTPSWRRVCGRRARCISRP